MKQRIKAIILAAGKGTRLQTEGCDLPKVMRIADGKPLLYYVLEGLDFIPKSDVVIVVGYKKESVMAGFPECCFAEQSRQLGTGDAVKAAKSAMTGFDGPVLVCCGDMPLITRETYRAMIDTYESSDAACVILTGTSDLNLPYGRIVRTAEGTFDCVVEEKDCSEEQKKITELNTGVYVFDCRKLFFYLDKISNSNAQNEYYLTDVPALMKEAGESIALCKRELGSQIIGVNTIEQLKQVEDILRLR